MRTCIATAPTQGTIAAAGFARIENLTQDVAPRAIAAPFPIAAQRRMLRHSAVPRS